jgi:hypothetical protein
MLTRAVPCESSKRAIHILSCSLKHFPKHLSFNTASPSWSTPPGDAVQKFYAFHPQFTQLRPASSGRSRTSLCRRPSLAIHVVDAGRRFVRELFSKYTEYTERVFFLKKKKKKKKRGRGLQKIVWHERKGCKKRGRKRVVWA